ncbi:MAG: hypothetical protein ACUVV5_06785 [Candidatus Aminicenantales bacterium]
MTTRKGFSLMIGAGLIFSLAILLPAETQFAGHFLFGFRFVETSGPGANSKYKEDFNLMGGARLYNFSLAYQPEPSARKWLDRLDFWISNFGGDPFEFLGVNLQKYGRYKLKYERKKAVYFYQDLHRPEGQDLYDFHTFGFDRVADAGTAQISLNKKIDLLFSFDRIAKNGHSRTTQDIERVEFELERPVQEEAKEIGAGLDLHSTRYSLFLETRRRDRKSENSLFLPGYADGGAGALYPTSLEFYFLNQPYEHRSFLHTLRLTARPVDNLLLTARAFLTQDDMELDYSESGAGTNYLGRLFNFTASGKGTFDRNIQMYDFDLAYLFLKKLSLTGAVRYHRFDQSGTLAKRGEPDSVDFGYETLAFDAGLEFLLSARFSLALGYRNESRQLDRLETATYEFETRRQGYFGNIKGNWRGLDITFDYEHSASQEPFTLMSAIDYDRMRWALRYRKGNFNLTGTYLWTDSQGEVFEQGFASSRNQLGLRGGYSGQRIQVFAGYSKISVEHKASRTVTYPPFWTGPGGIFPWDIFYEGRSTLLDASLSVKLKEAWKLGCNGNSYANKGSWEIRRVMLKAYFEIVLVPGYVAQLAYRFIDFKEKNSGFNDYRASLLELSFGYRWQ